MQVITWPGVELPPASEAGSTEATAMVFAAFSLVIAVLICPSLSWHASNRNVGASVLVAAAIYANLQNFLNAVIWPHDHLDAWYDGQVLCDVEIRLQVMLQNLYPAALSCILRALARAMDTDRARWVHTPSERRRTHAVDWLCCLGIPSVQMLTLYIVQPFRYWIYGISGCVIPGDTSWVRLVLVLIPPLLWTVYSVYLSIVVLTRLIRYRMTFHSLLRHANTTRSRFVRLYALCILSLLGYFSLHLYVLSVNIAAGVTPFSWKGVHHPTRYEWNTAVRVPSHGRVLFDRYIWMAGGLVIFILFGFGRDAVQMYRDGLRAIGMGRIFPSRRPPPPPPPPAPPGGHPSASVASTASKARMLLRTPSGSRTPASPTFNPGCSVTSTTSTTTSTTASEPSPKTATFPDTITRAGPKASPPRDLPPPNGVATRGGGKDIPPPSHHASTHRPDHLLLAQLSGPRPARIQSTITSGPPESPPTTTAAAAPRVRRPSLSRGARDVLVRTDIRQASESEEAAWAGGGAV